MLSYKIESNIVEWDQIIPQPQNINLTEEAPFVMANEIGVFIKDSFVYADAQYLISSLGNTFGIKAKLLSDSCKGAIILDKSLKSNFEEAYCLSVNSANIIINGSSPAGVYYGIQTLIKSMCGCKKNAKDITLRSVVINDYPRFSHRGMMLDVSRHFASVDEVKRFIDLLALHNLNVFHWHLTDDQGWRIEIKKYPKLTGVGAWRDNTIVGKYENLPNYQTDGKRYGGYYTQDQIKEVVAYAKERYITVIPEIDIPGHTQALLASYPELGCVGTGYKVCNRWGVIDDVICAGNEYSLSVLKDIFDEVIELFDSEYIHIGGDECPKKRWQDCPKCQAKINQLELKGDASHSKEYFLQNYFMSEIASHLKTRGRRVIGWDEILEGVLIPESVVMSWQGVAGGIQAARLGHDAIMTPQSHLYFNMAQSDDDQNEEYLLDGLISTQKVYDYEPSSPELTREQQKHIKGVQANLWTEFIPNERVRNYQTIPRIAALSEIAWSSADKKNYSDFLRRMPGYFEMYESLGYSYAKHLFKVNFADNYNIKDKTMNLALTTLGNVPVYYTLDGSKPSKNSHVYTDTIRLKKGCMVKASPLRNGILEEPATFEVNNNFATFSELVLNIPPISNHTYKGASVLVDGIKGSCRMDDGRWIGFEGALDAVIDLGCYKEVNKVLFNTFSMRMYYVSDPEVVKVFTSCDNINFKEVRSTKIIPYEGRTGHISNHQINIEKTKAKYIRLRIECEPRDRANIKDGYKYWMFIDDISIK